MRSELPDRELWGSELKNMRHLQEVVEKGVRIHPVVAVFGDFVLYTETKPGTYEAIMSGKLEREAACSETCQSNLAQYSEKERKRFIREGKQYLKDENSAAAFGSFSNACDRDGLIRVAQMRLEEGDAAGAFEPLEYALCLPKPS
jgi:hypothetical protein